MESQDLKDSQTITVRNSLIRVAPIAGLIIGAFAFLASYSSGETRPAIAWASLFGFNLLALFALKRDPKLAEVLFVCSIIVPTITISLLQYGTGAGLYLGVPAVAACAYAMMSAKVAFYLTFSYTAAIISILWVSRALFPENYAQLYFSQVSQFHVNTPVSIILSVVIVSGAVSIIKRTYLNTQSELVDEKDRVKELNTKVSDSLKAKTDYLDMSMQVQELGDVYGYFYYPQTDEMYRPKFGKSDYTVCTLAYAEESAIRMIGRDSQVIQLLKLSLKDHQDRDEMVATVFADGRPRYLRVSSKVVLLNEEVEKVILVVRDVTQTKILTDKLSQKANHDDLTGMLNRRRFEELFAESYSNASEGGAISTYLFIDLDRFKIVNDTSGHQAGDQMLIEISKILEQSVRKGDKIGRLGGDEFGLILMDCDNSMALRIAESIRQNVESFRFEWRGVPHRVEACIGVVAIDPELGTAAEIQALADTACYQAKRKGRNCVESVLGNENDYRSKNTEKGWVNQIDEALEQGLFTLFCQDIASAGPPNRNIVRREVLIRLYDSKEDRYISPDEFLAVAERYNRSINIDKWVVNKLVNTLQENINDLDGCEYWVNLSGQSVSDARFARGLYEKMSKSGLPEGLINFEITETSAIRNIESATNMMGKLQGLGCQFALDDFGAGHASFGYLRMLPVDCIKIDGMFIRDIVDDKVNRIFSRSIIEIAHTFNMKVTAEYVENQEIIDLLESMGVDYLQGYAISRPVPLDSIFDNKNQLIA